MKGRSTILLCIWSLFARGQNPWLVKDINSNHIVNQLSDGTNIGSDNSIIHGSIINIYDYAPPRMYNVNGSMLFFANDGKGGRGLWRTDGSSTGTYLLSTLGLAPTDTISMNDNAYSTGKILYFENENKTPGGEYGTALWRTDGTSAGTYALFSGPNKQELSYNDLNHGKLGAALGDIFYFIGAELNKTSDSLVRNIYRTDGTIAGTSIYQRLDAFLTTDYFGIYGQFASDDCMIAFGNRLLLSRNGQILASDGIQPMTPLPAVPGTSYEVVNDWVNVNDQYLIISAYPSINTSQLPDSGQLWRLNPTDAAPVVLARYMAQQGTPSFQLTNTDPVIANDRIFYYLIPSYPYPANIGATNGTISGTWTMNPSFPKQPFLLSQTGVTSYGIVFSTDSSATNTSSVYYAWDGLSPTSYRKLTALSDT